MTIHIIIVASELPAVVWTVTRGRPSNDLKILRHFVWASKERAKKQHYQTASRPVRTLDKVIAGALRGLPSVTFVFAPMTSPRKPWLLVVDDRAAVRGAVRHFIEATTPYKVCDTVDNDVSVIHNATEARCDLVLLNLSIPLQDSLVTVSLLGNKLPRVKIVGFSALSVADLRNQVSLATGFDAVIAQEQGLSKLVETLKALTPEPPRE